MSRNGSGVYSPPGSSFPAVANTLIEASKFNNTINDIGTALTESIARDGQTTITANIPMATFKFTGLGAGSAATDSARLGQVQDGSTQWCGTAGGTADALTLTPSPAITAYAAGQRFVFKASATNTSVVTVAISGLAAIPVYKSGANLAAGDIALGNIIYELFLPTATYAYLIPLGPNHIPRGWCATSAGSANAHVLTPDVAIKAYQPGARFTFSAGYTNTTAATVNISGLGTIAIQNQGAALTGGELVTGQLYDLVINAAGTAAELIPLGTIFANVSFTGTPTAPTAAEDTNTTQLATTAFVLGQAASQAQMEAASSTTQFATAGNTNWHPGVAKAWVKCDDAGSISASHNITSVTDTATGRATVNIATDFSSGHYSVVASVDRAANKCYAGIDNGSGSLAAGVFEIQCAQDATTLVDPLLYFAVAFGDQ